MTSQDGPAPAEPTQITELLGSLDMTQALESDEFRSFLDHVPIAVVIARVVRGADRIVYANKAYELVTGQAFSEISGKEWSVLDYFRMEDAPHLAFSEALPKCDDFVGTFKREQPTPVLVEAYSAVIEGDDAGRSYHIVALIDVTEREKAQREEFARQLRDKDMLLKELQHRVRNNLQLITALIRLDARHPRTGDRANLDTLASRIEALKLLYHALAPDSLGHTVDLGQYVSQISSAVMRTYAVEGIRLDMKVDVAPVSVNIAMPVGLLVNELLTNAFKYAFSGQESGTITVRCLHESDHYRIVVADDGIGLPDGVIWPVPGKLGALILQSLRENVKTEFSVESAQGKGVRATMILRYKAVGSKTN